MSLEDIIFQIFASINNMVKVTDLALKNKSDFLSRCFWNVKSLEQVDKNQYISIFVMIN